MPSPCCENIAKGLISQKLQHGTPDLRACQASRDKCLTQRSRGVSRFQMSEFRFQRAEGAEARSLTLRIACFQKTLNKACGACLLHRLYIARNATRQAVWGGGLPTSAKPERLKPAQKQQHAMPDLRAGQAAGLHFHKSISYGMPHTY